MLAKTKTFLTTSPHTTTQTKTIKKTTSELVYDRYLPPFSASPGTAHALRLLTFACLQLPVFAYLITQFQALGIELRTYTQGAVRPIVSVCVSAGVLLVSDLLGGLRAVAYTDVLQGVVLFIGSLVFLVIQGTELGGLPAAAKFYRNPFKADTIPAVAAMQRVPKPSGIVSYFDFV